MHNCIEFQSDLLLLFDQVNYAGGDKYWYLHPNRYLTYTYRQGVFTPEELDQIIVIGNNLRPKSATVNNNQIDTSLRISQTSWISGNDRTSWIFHRLTDTVLAQNHEFYKYDLSKIEALQFTCYSGGDSSFYIRHTDPIAHSVLPHNRKLSFVVHLSDPSDYTGGELLIHEGSQPTIAEKARGTVSFFPSHCLHEVTPVTSGTRYTLVGWVHGAPLK